MKKIVLISLFSLIFSESDASNEGSPIHPILKRLEECHSIEDNWDTRGMVRCELAAKYEWEKEMNKYYNLLIDALDDGYSDDSRIMLIKSQEAWIEYYEKEISFLDEYYINRRGGTMGMITSVSKAAAMMKSRAIQLMGYLGYYEYHE